MPQIQASRTAGNGSNRHFGRACGAFFKKEIVVRVDAHMGRVIHANSREWARSAGRACAGSVWVPVGSLRAPRIENAEVIRAPVGISRVDDAETVDRERRWRGDGSRGGDNVAARVHLLNFVISSVGDVEDISAVDRQAGRVADGSGSGRDTSGNGGDLRGVKVDNRRIPTTRQAEAVRGSPARMRDPEKAHPVARSLRSKTDQQHG